MKKSGFKSVDEYIASRPAEVRDVLERVRRAIRKALPRAEEVISYQMPAYRLDGRAVLYFAAWKQHYSLYPATDPLIAAFARELAAHELDERTIRFRFARRVPARLIGRIARFRAKEVAASRALRRPKAKR